MNEAVNEAVNEAALAELRRVAGRALVATDDLTIDGLLDSMERICSTLDLQLQRRADDGSVGDLGPDPARRRAVDVVDPLEVGVAPFVRMVAPRDLKRRTWGSPEGRFATLHALAHIEANAVNLALDAVHRFAGMPADYYLDWARVTFEERRHFKMLGQRLAAYGGTYGDLPCHNGLWEIAVKTAHDVGARMALVPLVFEARGLDVTPGLIERFERHGDPGSAAALRIVLRDEIGHVAVGRRWFAAVCADRGLGPVAEFDRLVAEMGLLIVPPFNMEARVAAGFEESDLRRWEQAFVGSV